MPPLNWIVVIVVLIYSVDLLTEIEIEVYREMPAQDHLQCGVVVRIARLLKVTSVS